MFSLCNLFYSSLLSERLLIRVCCAGRTLYGIQSNHGTWQKVEFCCIIFFLIIQGKSFCFRAAFVTVGVTLVCCACVDFAWLFLFSRHPNYLRACHRLREIFLRSLLRWWLCRLLLNLLRLLLCTGVFFYIPYYAWSEMPVCRELKHAFLNDIVNTQAIS